MCKDRIFRVCRKLCQPLSYLGKNCVSQSTVLRGGHKPDDKHIVGGILVEAQGGLEVLPAAVSPPPLDVDASD